MACRCCSVQPQMTCCTAHRVTCWPCDWSSASTDPASQTKARPLKEDRAFLLRSIVTKRYRSLIQLGPTLKQRVKLALQAFQLRHDGSGLLGRTLIKAGLGHFGAERSHLRFNAVDLRRQGFELPLQFVA